MKQEIDFAGIGAAALASAQSLLGAWLPSGRMEGREYVALNPRRADAKFGSFKINLSKGSWGDFATGDAGGDLISLYAYIFNVSQVEAAKIVAGQLGREFPEAGKSALKVPAEEYVPVLPAPKPLGDVKHPKLGKPSRLWEYKNADGALLFAVARFDLGDGKKSINPLTYGMLKNSTGWQWKSIPENRPLYGLDRLAKSSDKATVIIVEGEKAADAAQALLPHVTVMTWSGGSNAWGKTDWSPIKGRRVLLWPDADEPGVKAMKAVARHIEGSVQLVQIIDVSGQPKGWDAADADPKTWDLKYTKAWILARLPTEAKKTKPAPPSDSPEPPTPSAPPPNQEPDYEPPAEAIVDYPGGPIPLGYDRGVYFYLSTAEGQIHSLSAAAHTKSNLMGLASAAHYWERTSFVGKSGVRWDDVADYLMSACREAGVFSISRLRGRGAAFDDDRAVLHLGDRLIVDGDVMPIRSHRSRFIYETAEPLDMPISHNPLTTKEANRLMGLCDEINFESSDMAIQFAGFLVIAPVCGALAFRPHMWLTGSRGSGKSSVLKIAEDIIGPIAVSFQSKTTEAGIRQLLRLDARPVIFDEAEGESDADRSRVQQILDLARQASSESGAPIVKGSATGEAKFFRIRSSFLFSSIVLGLKSAADESRTVTLSLTGAEQEDPASRAERYERLQAMVADVATPEFSARLIARTMWLLPTIRANAEVFARAWAEIFGSRRQGDTLGAVIAGAYSLHSDKKINLATAREFLKGRKWVAVAAERTRSSSDAEKALEFILGQFIRIRSGSGSMQDRRIGSLIENVSSLNGTTYEVEGLADHGLRVQELNGPSGRRLVLWFARSNPQLARIFAGSTWGTGWASTILQLNGAMRSPAPIRFTKTSVSRAVGIPLSQIILSDENLEVKDEENSVANSQNYREQTIEKSGGQLNLEEGTDR